MDVALGIMGLACLVLLLEAAPQALYAQASGSKAGPRWRVLNGMSSFAVGAAMFVLTGGQPTISNLSAAVAVSACAAIIFSDVRYFLIPDICTAAILLAAVLRASDVGVVVALSGAAIGAFIPLLVVGIGRMRAVQAMGVADVKLAFALGALLGPRDIVTALLAASVLGLGYAGVAFLARRRFDIVPFGAALSAAAIAIFAARFLGSSS